jgi:Ion channel
LNLHVAATIAGSVLILAVLMDAFEAVVLPRRVEGRFRISTWFYRVVGVPWFKLASYVQSTRRRENFLAYFGPLSLILLLVLWAFGLILGFALLQYGSGEHLHLGAEPITFGTLVYLSGETFFTLGYGDIVPASSISRALAVLEAGMGFAFLGTVVGYLPTIYSAFSRREAQISLLDAYAGSPPTGSELLARLGTSELRLLDQLFRDWEKTASDVLESHISYPPLCYFRSQHRNQSWLTALTAILDATSLVIAGVEGLGSDQARLTFSMARHTLVDLSQLVNARYDPGYPDRLSPEELERLREGLSERGLELKQGEDFEEKLTKLRAMYEPYAQAVGRALVIALPPWISTDPMRDNWQVGPWDRIIQARGLAGLGHPVQHQRPPEDHF